ncbi:hypothetical protein KUF71_008019 [Frankliniella fusca]|uniref:Uncharacterized protein n=1 Tax=Frankliniella fusca TaxID=407009 RepID=A0AAE1LFZ2_9NEOP|nr:hypothetical protein KUF71_008019 [Frankliniella fusca]
MDMTVVVSFESFQKPSEVDLWLDPRFQVSVQYSITLLRILEPKSPGDRHDGDTDTEPMGLGAQLGGGRGGGAGRRETRAARAAGVAAGAGILVLLLLIVLLWTGVGTGVFRHAPQTAASARRRTPNDPPPPPARAAAAVPTARGAASASGPGATLGPGDGGGGGGADNDSEVVMIGEVLEEDKVPMSLAEVVLPDDRPLADSVQETAPPETQSGVVSGLAGEGSALPPWRPRRASVEEGRGAPGSAAAAALPGLNEKILPVMDVLLGMLARLASSRCRHAAWSRKGLATPSGSAAPCLAADPDPDPDPDPGTIPDTAALDLGLGQHAEGARGEGEAPAKAQQQQQEEDHLLSRLPSPPAAPAARAAPSHSQPVDAAADSARQHLAAARVRFEQLYAGVLSLAALRAAPADSEPPPPPAPAAVRLPRGIPADDSLLGLAPLAGGLLQARTWETMEAQMERQRQRLAQLDAEAEGRLRRREEHRRAEAAARLLHLPRDVSAVALASTPPPAASRAPSWMPWRRGDPPGGAASPGPAQRTQSQDGGAKDRPPGIRTHAGTAAMFLVAFTAGMLADNSLNALTPD